MPFRGVCEYTIGNLQLYWLGQVSVKAGVKADAAIFFRGVSRQARPSRTESPRPFRSRRPTSKRRPRAAGSDRIRCDVGPAARPFQRALQAVLRGINSVAQQRRQLFQRQRASA